MDEITKRIVEMTIKKTAALLDDGKLSWDVAREGVIRIILDLCEKHPGYEIAIKNSFEQFIICNDAKDAEHLEQNHSSELQKRRRHGRMYLFNKKTTMRVESNAEYSVILSDLSVSGAGIKTEIKPLCGSDVMVGSVPTTVVRHFAEGIGCQFLQQLADENLRETFGIQQSAIGWLSNSPANSSQSSMIDTSG
jgi:PilZ domain